MSLAAYAERFERFAAALPEAERAARRAQLQRFVADGFPTPRLEEWHYTDLAPLSQRAFEPAAGGNAALAPHFLAGTDRLVYVGGMLVSADSTAPERHSAAAPAQDEGVYALNAAFARDGLLLRLGRGERLPRPLQVLIAGADGAVAAMTHQRHRIELAENTEATVIFQFLNQGGGGLATHVIDVRLAPGARLNLFRIQDERADATLLTRCDVRQERDSVLHAVSFDCGGGLVRHDLNILLAEAGAETGLYGLYQPAAGAHLDNHTRIVHAAPQCRSREQFKGIVDARARAIFNGKVVVQAGAQKTDSEQRVANLLLSPKAEVNAKPELEIYADDVKCAHGATVGQLDETALEYLRSRGVPPAEARALLLRAFATEVLDHVPLAPLRAALAARLGLAGTDAWELEA
ncbi:MAG: Fe-S cluster assembly protein SufD [Nevskia sp.]|nr:Fe-S cluster assembly protein SufD [Nevskia sp.]